MNKYLRICLVILFAVSVVVAVTIWKGMHSFLFAWTLNFMLMIAVSYLTLTLNLELKSSYYDSKKWEDDGKIYKWFGINGFRKILVWIGWEKITKVNNPVKKNLDALKQLEHSTRQSEFGHLVIFFMVLIPTLFIGFNYGFKQSLWLIGLNIVLNAYPVVLQRYNRPRLQKVIHNSKRFS